MVTLPFLDDAYQLVCLSPPEELPPFAFDPFLYVDPRHVALQNGPNWQLFMLLQKGRAVALAHFFSEANTFLSPWRAPFGGIQTLPNLPIAILRAFLGAVHQHVRAQGAKEIKWLQCPDVYAPEVNTILRQALPEIGYQLLYDQRNHHLPVTSQAFSEILHPSTKRRLRKCKKAGFTVQQESVAQLPEAYALLQKCRQEKQKPLSLSSEQLQQYFHLFPDQYHLFTVRLGAELAAVGVTVRINGQILNHLYPASPTQYNAYSPTILLTEGIYQFCQQDNISMLDLGVSAPGDEDEADYQGLFTFKKRLGGVETFKPTFGWKE